MRAAVITLLFMLVPLAASATVIDGEIIRQSGAGTFIKLDTADRFSVGADNFNTDHLYAFDEDQNIALDAPIAVDIGGIEGQIAAGTIVASHYVFFDSIDGIQLGYVDFDADILGIAALPGSLDATDFLANTNVDYISTDLRGLERGDYAWVDEERAWRLWVYWAGSSPGDYIRVFTERSEAAPMM